MASEPTTRQKQLRDWYETAQPLREDRRSTPTLGAEQNQKIARELAHRIRLRMGHEERQEDLQRIETASRAERGLWGPAGPPTEIVPVDPPPAPLEPIFFKGRREDRKTAAELHRRNCDGVTIEREVAFNSIATPSHGYSPEALRIERNRRKRERKQARS